MRMLTSFITLRLAAMALYDTPEQHNPDAVPTVYISTPNGPIRINATDFDNGKHVQVNSDGSPFTGAGQDLANAPVPVPPGTIVKPGEAVPVDEETAGKYATQIGTAGKWFVTDKNGTKTPINGKGYATQEAAHAAINAKLAGAPAEVEEGGTGNAPSPAPAPAPVPGA